MKRLKNGRFKIGHEVSFDIRNKISKGNLGKKRTLKCKLKISKSRKGKHHSLITRKKIGKYHEKKNAWNWTGNEVSYKTLHAYINRKLGKPNLCEHCKSINERKYEWANKKHTYKRNLKDWIRLCVKCHKKYDKK